MCALEEMVLDPFLALPVRVAAGKLRLCIQASIRHDDLVNTPLAACEWVRKPGDCKVIGLRSRAVRAKAGPRLWVASLRGASEAGDGWLVRLMSLVLAAHRASWRSAPLVNRYRASCRTDSTTPLEPHRQGLDAEVLHDRRHGTLRTVPPQRPDLSQTEAHLLPPADGCCHWYWRRRSAV